MVPTMVPDGSANTNLRFARGFRWFRDGSGMVPRVSPRPCRRRCHASMHHFRGGGSMRFAYPTRPHPQPTPSHHTHHRHHHHEPARVARCSSVVLSTKLDMAHGRYTFGNRHGIQTAPQTLILRQLTLVSHTHAGLVKTMRKWQLEPLNRLKPGHKPS